MLYDKLMFAWRTVAQVVVGALVTRLAAVGVGLDPAAATGLEEALYGLGIAAYAFAVHWLETRSGESLPARVARWVARVLLLGAPATVRYERQPAS